MTKRIKYSIIVPTCSKALTKRCLSYLSKINHPKYGYEVIVVQNATNDDIKPLVKEYSLKIPDIKCFFEEDEGLMASRHRGAKEAQGEILCYLDDDSFVSQGYLIGIEEAFNDENTVIAGGPNIGLFEGKKPNWLKYFWQDCTYGEYMSYLSLNNFYNKEMKMPAWFVFGCNMAIRKSTFLKMGGTNPDVMPKYKQRFLGDGETAISCTLNQKGHYALYSPKIKIHHLVPKARMNLEYFKKRGYYQGICDSFSKIRKENGFEYFSFTPNENVETIKAPLLLRRYKKFVKPLIRLIQKKTESYQEFLNVKEEYEKSYQEGFEFHQNEVKNDPELLAWVLKKDYLD